MRIVPFRVIVDRRLAEQREISQDSAAEQWEIIGTVQLNSLYGVNTGNEESRNDVTNTTALIPAITGGSQGVVWDRCHAKQVGNKNFFHVLILFIHPRSLLPFCGSMTRSL